MGFYEPEAIEAGRAEDPPEWHIVADCRRARNDRLSDVSSYFLLFRAENA
jgi:hypothetical protein